MVKYYQSGVLTADVPSSGWSELGQNSTIFVYAKGMFEISAN
jgi:hypothetical protein